MSLLLVEVASQDIPDGVQFSAERAFVTFSEFSQGIQQVIQGKHVFGGRPFSPVVSRSTGRRAKPRHAAFSGWINDQTSTTGVTLGAGWKFTFLG